MVHSGHTYTIKNVKGGTVVDLSGGDNKSIIGYGDHGGPNQKWAFNFDGEGWTVKSSGSGQYLGIESDPEDGVPLVAVDSPFFWDIQPDEDHHSVYRFFIPRTKFNMDLADHGSSEPGTKVQLWSQTKGKGQTWILEDA